MYSALSVVQLTRQAIRIMLTFTLLTTITNM